MKRLDLRHSFALALLFALIVPILAACGGGTTPPAAATAVRRPKRPPPLQHRLPRRLRPLPPRRPTAAEAPTAAPAVAPTAAPAATAGRQRVARGRTTWPETLAPQKASFGTRSQCLNLNYEGLTRFDKDLKTVPAAAEKWEYNQDGTADHLPSARWPEVQRWLTADGPRISSTRSTARSTHTGPVTTRPRWT